MTAPVTRARPGVAARVLAAVAERWPSPQAEQDARFGASPGTKEYAAAYAREQYMRKVWFGFGAGRSLPPLWGRDVLEIGCGHGGISKYLADLGARSVVGIDLEVRDLAVGLELVAEIRRTGGTAERVHLVAADAVRTCFRDASFDVIIADNLFEHVDDPGRLLAEARRLLRADGRVIVPTFSSIKSKYGLHLKQGLRVPWANLVFSEPTIVDAVELRARHHPELHEVYPGLKDRPARVRDLRRHRDLNELTYRDFRELVDEAGFTLEYFRIQPTLAGMVVRKLAPRAETTTLLEILSTGASAALRVQPD